MMPMAAHSDPRQRIVALASEKFFTFGFARVTMDEIASELGMSKKTLYKYFAGKEQLLQTVIETFYADIEAELARILQDPDLEYTERLHRFVAVIGDKLTRVRAPQLDLQRSAPAVWQRVETLRQEVILQPLADLLRAGIDCGILRNDLHPEVVLRMVVTSLEALGSSDLLVAYPLSVSDLFQTVVTVVLEGMLTETARDG